MSYRRQDQQLWWLALLGSVLLHLVVLIPVVFFWMQESGKKGTGKKQVLLSPEMIEVVKKSSLEDLSENHRSSLSDKKKPDLSYMKTTDKQESKEAPKDPVFIGQRNTKLASERETHPDGLPYLPSTDGREKRDDEAFSLVDQRGQLGEIEHETISPQDGLGKQAQVNIKRESVDPQHQKLSHMEKAHQGDVSPNSASDPLMNPKNNPLPEEQEKHNESKNQEGETLDGQENVKTSDNNSVEKAQKDQNSEGKDEHSERNFDQKERKQTLSSEEETQALLREAEVKSKKRLQDIMKTAEQFKLPDPTVTPLSSSPKKERKSLKKTSELQARPQPKVAHKSPPVYDPALSGGGRPGYKEESKKTRLTGRMSSSGEVAADVKATPLGVYLSQFMRLLNRNWDAECMERRDFIIPGSLKIRMVLNSNGSVSGIRLISREGASEMQKGFTYKAIKETKLPPMPKAAKKELGEESTEIMIDFYF